MKKLEYKNEKHGIEVVAWIHDPGDCGGAVIKMFHGRREFWLQYVTLPSAAVCEQYAEKIINLARIECEGGSSGEFSPVYVMVNSLNSKGVGQNEQSV